MDEQRNKTENEYIDSIEEELKIVDDELCDNDNDRIKLENKRDRINYKFFSAQVQKFANEQQSSQSENHQFEFGDIVKLKSSIGIKRVVLYDENGELSIFGIKPYVNKYWTTQNFALYIKTGENILNNADV